MVILECSGLMPVSIAQKSTGSKLTYERSWSRSGSYRLAGLPLDVEGRYGGIVPAHEGSAGLVGHKYRNILHISLRGSAILG